VASGLFGFWGQLRTLDPSAPPISWVLDRALTATGNSVVLGTYSNEALVGP